MTASADRVIERAVAAAFGAPLITNVLRSLIVEAMVAEALEPEWIWCSADYGSYDFRSGSVRLEIKQAALLQTWNRDTKRVSDPRFDIAARKGEWRDGTEWVPGERRNADVYAFALHTVTDGTADHRLPEQWRFFVVQESKLPIQKSLGLNPLRRMAEPIGIDDLKGALRPFLTR